jgi:beta-lactam-binding protein with PASTA domain
VAAAVILVVLAFGIYLANSNAANPNGPARQPDIAVPKVVGLTQGDAELRLRKANLKPKVVDGRPDKRPAGTVIDTEPLAGQLVPPGSEVGLVLSIGPGPKE